MTKRDIAKRVAFEADVPVTVAADIVQRVLNGIVDAIGTDGGIELRNFGVFKAWVTRERKARNPRTGEKLMAAPKARVRFIAGKELEERLGKLKAVEPVAAEGQ